MVEFLMQCQDEHAVEFLNAGFQEPCSRYKKFIYTAAITRDADDAIQGHPLSQSTQHMRLAIGTE